MRASEMSRLRQWVSVYRLQALPITLAPAVVGYTLSYGSVYQIEFVQLSMILVLAHGGLMGVNEFLDRPFDVRSERHGKPLAYGDVPPKKSLMLSSVMVAGSVVGMMAYAPAVSSSSFGIAVSLLFVYNLGSKTDGAVDLLTGISSGLIVISAATFNGGGISTPVSVFALGFGVITISIHMFADLKDVGSEEDTLYSSLGCKLVKHGSTVSIQPSLLLYAFVLFILVAEVGYIVMVSLIAPSDIGLVYLLVVGGAFLSMMKSMLDLNEPTPTLLIDIEKLLVIYVLSCAVLVLYPLTLYVSWEEIVVPFSVLVVLPFIVQKIQYGKAFYFP